jgi:tetratricopeptide (TPR) repeat protein
MKKLLAFVAIVSLIGISRTSKAEQSEKAETRKATMAGWELTANQARDLEAALAKKPDDLTTRTKLLGYYNSARHDNAEARADDLRHVLWIIKNRPDAYVAGLPECYIDAIEDPAGFRQAKQAWLEQVRAHEKNATILGNAANFFLIRERAIAEELLQKTKKLEPNNPEWPDDLGHLYLMDGNKNSAVKALAEYEKAQSADTSESGKYSRLEYLAKAAFDAGEMDKASQYAEELLKAGRKLPKDWNYGNAIHHGNNLLGRVALKKGKVEQAEEYLLKAGQTPGSPQLDSFGPKMSLAKELLEAGKKDTVLQYFELCRKFWKGHGETLDNWTKDVKAAQVPDFGANLDY